MSEHDHGEADVAGCLRCARSTSETPEQATLTEAERDMLWGASAWSANLFPAVERVIAARVADATAELTRERDEYRVLWEETYAQREKAEAALAAHEAREARVRAAIQKMRDDVDTWDACSHEWVRLEVLEAALDGDS